MVSKAHRLNSQEVASAMKSGRRASTGLFSLSYIQNNKGKIAVIIPKKVAKTSVLRHKHKRRIMAAVLKYANIHPLPAAHVVLTLRQDIANLDFKDLCAHIDSILAKI